MRSVADAHSPVTAEVVADLIAFEPSCRRYVNGVYIGTSSVWDVRRWLTSSLTPKRRWAPTSPKTGALAFISVLPWRINDEAY